MTRSPSQALLLDIILTWLMYWLFRFSRTAKVREREMGASVTSLQYTIQCPNACSTHPTQTGGSVYPGYLDRSDGGHVHEFTVATGLTKFPN